MLKPHAVPIRAALVIALLSAVGLSAHADSTTATASAEVLTPMTITKTTDMVFGNLVAGNGIVTLATDGTRTKAGTTPLPSGVTATAGHFTVGGSGTQTFAITYPSSPTQLVSGSDTMAFTYFSEVVATAAPTGMAAGAAAATGTLTAGAAHIYVGGTVTVGSPQPAGTYTATLTVNVDYN